MPEKRVDPDDGAAYTFDELAAYYTGKFKKKAIEQYWENECTPTKGKAKAKAKVKAKASKESAPKAKAKVKTKAKAKAQGKRLSPEDEEPDGPLAKQIAAVLPYFPFKKIERFYDIQGLLKHPKLFNAMCAVMAKRYRRLKVTKVVGFEARGFLFTPVAIKLGVPFVMLRKSGKMPNSISSAPYTKEYAGVDVICLQKGAIVPGDKVALIDDLVATGGTLCAGIELIKSVEAEVTECGCMVELKALNGRDRVLKAGSKAVWSFVTEDILTTAADLPDGYNDDGEAH